MGTPSVGRYIPRRTRPREAATMAQARGAISPNQRLRTRIAASLWAAFFGGAPRARRTHYRGLLRLA